MRVTEETSTRAAVEAIKRGYQPVPIMDGAKRPYGHAWTHLRWESEEQAETSFSRWAEEGASGIGLLLGEPSGGLIDIDLDHPKAMRLRDHFLPPTSMQTGRVGRPRSHYWYRVTDDLPSTRRYKMPDNSVSVELRSTGAQTVIPPTTHPTGEKYRWEGTPWGGEVGPAEVDGNMLAIQIALLGLGTVLLEAWPKAGSRHDAYLALAGGLLRFGDGVHPYWERNLQVLIGALADVTNDEDGADSRVAEVMGSTLVRLREGGKAVGFPALAEIIGTDHAELARRMSREVESLGGFKPDQVAVSTLTAPEYEQSEIDLQDRELTSTLPPETRNPLEERISSWEAVDLEPYLSGQIVVPEPSVLRREDGKGLFYPGRVNSLFGMSESAKSWIALGACVQEMSRGDRVVFIDLEDEPAGTLGRVRSLGAADDDLKNQFRYVHPEGPLADMQRYRFGHAPTEDGQQSSAMFKALLDSFDPTLIVADGMTVLYGLHGHDTNEATATDVITSWLKSMTRGGRTTVIVIDHTGKGGGQGSSPIGAHHKVAMVQGSAIRADAINRPMPGKVGRINLVVFKDRPGAVRAFSTEGSEQRAGVVNMDSTEPGIVRLTVEVPDGQEVTIGGNDAMDAKLAALAASQEVQDEILQMFGGDLEMEITTAEAMERTGAAHKDVFEAWEQLTRAGVLVRTGSTRWTKFRLVDPTDGEEHDDE